MTTLRAVAPGKLILLGEYAVLEGSDALVAAVDAQSRVSLTVTDQSSSVLHAPQIGCEEVGFIWEAQSLRWTGGASSSALDKTGLVQTVLGNFYDAFTLQFPGKGIRLEIDTEDFFSKDADCKLGLGSSASVCVSLTAAFLTLLGTDNKPTRDAIYAEAFRLHRASQGGLGSGVDVAASVFGGYLQFSPSRNKEQLPAVYLLAALEDLKILPIFTGKAAVTVGLVKQVYALRKANPQKYQALMNVLCDLGQEGLTRFCEGDSVGFMGVVAQYSRALGQLGDAARAPIVSPVHRQAQEATEKLSGVYKVSGAGGGDFGLAFLSSEAQAVGVEKELKSGGWSIPNMKFGVCGVTVESESS